MGAFVEIAKQYERYEKKEDTPKEIAANAGLGEEKNGGDDFWDDVEVMDSEMEIYRDPTNNKYGLKAKKGLKAIPAEYNNLVASNERKGLFIGEMDDKVVALNAAGNVLATLPGKEWRAEVNGASKPNDAPDLKCYGYELEYREHIYFQNGGFSRTEKIYNIRNMRGMTLIVSTGSSSDEKEEVNWDEVAAECHESYKRQAESDGYKLQSKMD